MCLNSKDTSKVNYRCKYYLYYLLHTNDFEVYHLESDHTSDVKDSFLCNQRDPKFVMNQNDEIVNTLQHEIDHMTGNLHYIIFIEYKVALNNAFVLYHT